MVALSSIVFIATGGETLEPGVEEERQEDREGEQEAAAGVVTLPKKDEPESEVPCEFSYVSLPNLNPKLNSNRIRRCLV